MRDILICGDILRANLELTHRPYNTRWFSALIRQAIAPLGIQSEVLGHCPPDFDFEEFYKAIYEEPGDPVLHKWAQFYDAQAFDADMSARLFDVFSNRIVILFEGSRSILNYISSIGGVYLNFRVSPLRFAADLVFIIESNSEPVQSAIEHFRLGPAFVDEQIANLKAQLRPSAVTFERKTLVYLGQVAGDASLISDGAFTNIAIPSDLEINQFGPMDIFHKPHPIDTNTAQIDRWMGFFPTSRLLEMPTYGAFCSEGDLTFVSVSSGAGYEAQLLGHTCHFVSQHNWSLTSPRWQRFTPVLCAYWYPGFWEAIFGALSGQALDDAALQLEQQDMTFTPDRLRGAIDAKWAERSFSVQGH